MGSYEVFMGIMEKQMEVPHLELRVGPRFNA